MAASMPALAALVEALGGLAKVDQPIGALTTYRVGGNAAVMVDATREEDLLAVRRALSGLTAPVPVLVLGKGSNVLVADEGFAGLVVRVGMQALELPPAGAQAEGPAPLTVRAGAGLGLPVLARRTADAGLAGLEWCVGIPGSVGGALAMNAGGHGSDTESCLVRYHWMDLGSPAGGDDRPDRLAFGYRASSLTRTQVVVWAELAVHRGNPAASKAEIADIVRWRRDNQPGGSNAGSVFTNPSGDTAGRLVDAAGLKGFRLGTARVSQKHANFIQADDRGAAADVYRLIGHVRSVVAERFGVVLRPEVRLVGFPPADNGVHDAQPDAVGGGALSPGPSAAGEGSRER
jgi:UDP-N-acetylmuramate dehydrogenase